MVTIRNFLLLQIPGDIRDSALAADIALHFWYSTYLSTEYWDRIQLFGLREVDLKNPLNYCCFRTQSGARVTCEVTLQMIGVWAFMTGQMPFPFDQEAAAKKRHEEL